MPTQRVPLLHSLTRLLIGPFNECSVYLSALNVSRFYETHCIRTGRLVDRTLSACSSMRQVQRAEPRRVRSSVGGPRVR